MYIVAVSLFIASSSIIESLAIPISFKSSGTPELRPHTIEAKAVLILKQERLLGQRKTLPPTNYLL